MKELNKLFIDCLVMVILFGVSILLVDNARAGVSETLGLVLIILFISLSFFIIDPVLTQEYNYI